MVDMQKKAPGEGISTSVNSERSIIVYEKHPPSNPKRRPRKAVFVYKMHGLCLYNVGAAAAVQIQGLLLLLFLSAVFWMCMTYICTELTLS